MSLLEFQKRVQSLNVNELIKEVLNDKRLLNFIEESNVSNLKKGERSDGSSLPNYSRVSVEKYGKPDGAIKLFDTGAFYESITALVRNLGIDFTADVIKGKGDRQVDLASIYGEKIIGINKEQNKEVGRLFLQIATEKIQQYIIA